jgi:iron-sulfur cluster insertion protein
MFPSCLTQGSHEVLQDPCVKHEGNIAMITEIIPMNKMQIHITDDAFRRVKELASLEGNSNLLLRISVDGGGCSGFTYKYEMTKDVNIDDLIFEGEGARVLIDPMSIEYMKDSVVDFIEELGSSYFSIKNPQATAKCGCGNSFAV